MQTRTPARWLCVLAIAAAPAVVACGGEEGSKAGAPKGSPQNPVVAQHPEENVRNESAPSSKPGYQKLVERQSRRPQRHFTPCNLVTKSQARAIVGTPMEQTEASQGPTCIYRSRDGKSFVTLAVQDVGFATIRRQMRQRRQVEIADRPAICGNYGQPMLYVPLSRGRVLSVAGRCDVATRFAAKALPQLRN